MVNSEEMIGSTEYMTLYVRRRMKSMSLKPSSNLCTRDGRLNEIC